MLVIQIKFFVLIFKVGCCVFVCICECGLQLVDVGIVFGVVGGLKVLGIQGLDLVIFGEWLLCVLCECLLIGVFIGFWCFVSVCLFDVVVGFICFGELYIWQCFFKGVSIVEVLCKCVVMFDDLFVGQDVWIFDNLLYCFNVVVVKSYGCFVYDYKVSFGLGLFLVICDNLIGCCYLYCYFEWVILYDVCQVLLLVVLIDFLLCYLYLDGGNLCQVLFVFGLILMVMEGVCDLFGVGFGIYCDGGLFDYYFDLFYEDCGVVFYLYFIDKVIFGWFDKGLFWCCGDVGCLQDVLLLVLLCEYLVCLLYVKLLDCKDFICYFGDDDGCECYWCQVMVESCRFGDEFFELVDGGWFGECL